MKRLIFIFLISSNYLSAQVGEHYYNIVSPYTFPLNQLSVYGYSSVAGDYSSKSSINPAALISEEFPSFSIGYQFQNVLGNSIYVENKRINPGIPQSLSVIWPFQKLTAALAFNQVYNNNKYLDFPEIEDLGPDGAGELFTASSRTSVYSYSLSASYNLSDAWETVNGLCIGLRLNYNSVSNSDQIWKSTFEQSFGGFSFSAGLIYDMSERNNTFIMGASYDSKLEINYLYKPGNSQNLLFQPDVDTLGGTNKKTVADLGETLIRIFIPSKLSTGLFYKSNNSIGVLANCNLLFWNEDKVYNVEPQISASMVYDFSDKITSSLGFLYSSLTAQEGYTYFNETSSLSAFYITIGMHIKFSQFNAGLSVADSHLGGGEWRKQTIVKIGCGYML